MSKSENLELNRVAFRAPQIWKSDIDLWFFQVESSFITAGITEELTKFHCVVSALDVEILSYVRDLIKSPPTDKPYSKLKERITQQFSQSESARLRMLFQDLHLGDSKPSQLLHKMQSLADSDIDDKVIKTLWLQRLPEQMQKILSISKDNLSDLAQIADKINEVSGCHEISSVVNSSNIDMLQKQITDLTHKVDNLISLQNKTSRSRSRSKSKTRQTLNINKNYCWYHFKFGNKAHKCVKPCNFSEN